AREVDPDDPLRGEFSLLDPERELGYRCERNVFIILRQWTGLGLAPDKSRARRTGVFTGQYWVPARAGGEGRIEYYFAWSHPSLIERSHSVTPVAGRQGQVLGVPFHFHQLFSLGKGCSRHLRSNSCCSAEGRRCAGRRHSGLLVLTVGRDGSS